MTENEFYIIKHKFETSLETFIEACEEFGTDIAEEVSEVLADYDIEL